MPIMLNTILREAGLAPADVRLLRHKDTRSTKGRSPYELWRDNRPQFDNYQSTQSVKTERSLKLLFGQPSSLISTKRPCSVDYTMSGIAGS